MKGMIGLSDTFRVLSALMVILSPMGVPPRRGAVCGRRAPAILICPVFVREVRPEEYERAGAIVLEAYRALPGYVSEPAYERELVDVAGRAARPRGVAVDLDRDVVGCVTYVARSDEPVRRVRRSGGGWLPDARGGSPARAAGPGGRSCSGASNGPGRGRAGVMIHSTPWMVRAHGLYGRLGFDRRPDLDWQPGAEHTAARVRPRAARTG